MDISEKILSKDEINRRFITAVHAVLANNLISSKAGLAESLGVKPAKFSEILNNRMKAGVDMIAIMCDFYKVSPDWLLMSRGKNIFRKDTLLPDIWVDDENIDRKLPIDTPDSQIVLQKDMASSSILLEYIHEKDNVIKEQAEEIGSMRERIKQLENELKKAVSDVHDSRIANAG